MTSAKRLFLSPPHMDGGEEAFVREAFQSNYIAPLGPMVDAFEEEMAAYTGIPYGVALSSGTAAMQLALRLALERKGFSGFSGRPCAAPAGHAAKPPIVIASTLTFIGSVSPAALAGCEMRFIDCEEASWTMDPALLEQEMAACREEGREIAAVIPTDLYGQCCNLPRLCAIADKHGVPVICDSAEAMGARYDSADGQREGEADWRHAGWGAWATVYSFNGNKIMTTSGGGLLASRDKDLIDHARKLSQQARDPVPWYEHSEIGYNYRMSNILAAIGRGQLRVLEARVRRKREITESYRRLLKGVRGVSFMPEPDWNRANRWLTVIEIDPAGCGAGTGAIRETLERENIEARPVWKPMHMQPVFKGCRIRGGAVSERLFARGLCLPSGTAMTEADIERVVRVGFQRNSLA